MPDAVVIGAGPNGLVAANLLADAGWTVEVLEEQDEPGGAVRSDRGVHPDYVNDLCSSFYPLAAASPVLARPAPCTNTGLRLEPCATGAGPSADRTAAARCWSAASPARRPDWRPSAPGDGAAWQRLCDLWDRVGGDLLDALFTPFPPLRATARLAAPGARRRRAAAGAHAAAARTAPGRGGVQRRGGPAAAGGQRPARRPRPRGGGQRRLRLADVDARPEPTAFPVPVGGAQALTAALVRRLQRRGGVLRCGERVDEIVVRSGRAVAVRTAIGEAVPAPPRRAGGCVRARPVRPSWSTPEHLPGRLLADLRRFQWDFATFKVDWALGGPVPWTAGDAATRGHRASGRRHGRTHPLRRPDRHGPGARPALRPVRPDDHRGRHPLPGRHRVGLGLHPRTPPDPGGRGGGRPHRVLGPGGAGSDGRPAGGAGRALRPGLPLPDQGAPDPRPAHAGGDWTPICTAAPSTAVRPPSTSSWCSVRCPASVARRPRSRASIWPRPGRTRAAACTAPPAPTRPARHCAPARPAVP